MQKMTKKDIRHMEFQRAALSLEAAEERLKAHDEKVNEKISRVYEEHRAERDELRMRVIDAEDALTKFEEIKKASEGTTSYPLPEGREIKVERRFSYKVIGTGEQVEKLIYRFGEHVFGKKYSLELRAFRKLTEAQQDVILRVIKIVKGDPRVSIVTPKRSNAKHLNGELQLRRA